MSRVALNRRLLSAFPGVPVARTSDWVLTNPVQKFSVKFVQGFFRLARKQPLKKELPILRQAKCCPESQNRTVVHAYVLPIASFEKRPLLRGKGCRALRLGGRREMFGLRNACWHCGFSSIPHRSLMSLSVTLKKCTIGMCPRRGARSHRLGCHRHPSRISLLRWLSCSLSGATTGQSTNGFLL